MKRSLFPLVAALALLATVAGTALGTPPSPVPTLSAETARGPLVDRPLDVSMEFEDGSKSEVELKTKGPIEVAVQRIVARPGATFGWHTRPGPTIVTVLSGTLTLYHAEHCTVGIDSRRARPSRTCPMRSTWLGTTAPPQIWGSTRRTSCR